MITVRPRDPLASLRFPPPGRRLSAFTMVEMLVVIAVIGILAGLTIPVVGKVRREASQAKCSAKLRDNGIWMQLYAQDNNGMLPPLLDEKNQLWSELISLNFAGNKKAYKRPFECECQSPAVRFGYNDRIGSLLGGIYDKNGNFLGTDGQENRYRRTINIVKPAQKVLLGEVSAGRSIAPNVKLGGWNRMAGLHNGKTQLLFCDGHVGMHADSELTMSGNFDPAFDPGK